MDGFVHTSDALFACQRHFSAAQLIDRSLFQHHWQEDPERRGFDRGAHEDLLPIARDDARLALDKDPKLESPRGQALRTLLYLFERDAAVRLLRSG